MLSCPGHTPALPWGSLRVSGAPGVEHPARDRSKPRVREVMHGEHREEQPAGICCEGDLELLGSPEHH